MAPAVGEELWLCLRKKETAAEDERVSRPLICCYLWHQQSPSSSKVKLHQLTTATNITLHPPLSPFSFLLSVCSSSGSCKFYIYNWAVKCSVTRHPQSLHARDAPIRNWEPITHHGKPDQLKPIRKFCWYKLMRSFVTWFQFYFDFFFFCY